MAQRDTGLGWSAEETYLTESAVTIATVGTQYMNLPGAENQPIPITSGSAPDIANNGLYLYTTTDNVRFYLGASKDGAFVAASQPSGSNRRITAICQDSTCVLYSVFQRVNTGEYGTVFAITPYDTVSASGGLWYTYFQSRTPAITDLNLPVTSAPYSNTDRNQAAIMAGLIVTSSDPVDKTTPGYAVACVVKWYTQNGTEMVSPILISSNTDYSDMSTTATGFNFAELNYLLSGTRFYMGFWDIPASYTVGGGLPVVDLRENGNLTLDQVFMYIVSTSYAHIIIISSPDPYETEGGGSGEEGGDGEETGDDDAGIEAGSDFPSAINTGFCRIYCPSESDLRDLSNYLWSNSYDLAQVKKLFSNPLDSILGLSAVPIRLLGSSVSFSLGGVPITGMTLPMVTQQRYTYHMGSITIKERWGSYLDYDPYTKFSIFLPFIGMRELAADDIMGKTVSLVYDIDILTGMCVARLQAGTNCLYEWGGNCAIQLPVNSRNWDSVFSTAVSAVGGIVSAVTGGSAPLVAGSVASAALQTVSMKPRIDKSSTIGGAAGWLGQMTPYIIRTTPEAFIPTDQNKFIGYPAYINVNLGAISGYNEVESIHLENVTATGAELEEIESILKGGVIF